MNILNLLNVPNTPPASPCKVCGAEPLTDHEKDCRELAVMRAQAYPDIIGDNGRYWYDNVIARLERENEALRAQINQTSE